MMTRIPGQTHWSPRQFRFGEVRGTRRGLSWAACLALLGGGGAISSCSSDLVTEAPAPRLVVLQYSTDPTTVDSLAASATGRVPASVYHFLNAVGVVTTVPASAFATLQPAPDSVTDTNTLECNLVDVRITTVSLPTVADSTWLSARGIFPLLFNQQLFGHLTTATLDRIGNLQRNENIVAGHLVFDCFIAFGRSQ